MKNTQRFFAAVLCAAIFLCAAGCAKEEAIPTTVVPVDSAKAQSLYATARKAIDSPPQ